MLRKIRIALATVMFIGITLLFLDFTGTMHHWVSWMPKIQFLEAVLMGELDAQDTVLGGSIGTERRGHCSTPCADAHLRTHLLFNHLSVRHHAGHLRMVRQESQEEPLHVF